MININEHSRNSNAPLLLENTFDHNGIQTSSISMSHGFQNFMTKHYHIKYHWRTSLAFYRVISLFRAMLSHRRSLPIYCLEKPLRKLPKLSCSCLGLLLETNVISPQRLNFCLQICIFLSFLKENKKIQCKLKLCCEVPNWVYMYRYMYMYSVHDTSFPSVSTVPYLDLSPAVLL